MSRLKWSLLLVFLLWGGCQIDSYRDAVGWRRDIAVWDHFESPGGMYVLEIGYADEYWKWARLYRKGSTEVIADRWFNEPEHMRVGWDPDRIYYNLNSTDTIRLPPYWFEKWLACIP